MMKRTLAALGLVASMIFALPASAHLKSFEDGTDDSYEAGDTDGTAHTTPIDLAGASFREKPKAYKVTMIFHDPLDMDLLCSSKTCGGDTIESHGFLSSDFYRFGDDTRKNWYFAEVGNDGSGNPIAGLFKVTQTGNELVSNATATLSDDGLTMKVKAPRGKMKGHKKGKKIYWNAVSVYWQPAETGFCEFTAGVDWGNACVDWIPDLSDAPHKLQN
jgi:hypothetical protein